jgi:hypothetical protein
MHVYMRNGETIRFRCADYPHCRTFLKCGRPAAPGGGRTPGAEPAGHP